MKKILLKDVCQKFSNSSAPFIDQLSMEIHAGEIWGILGHNGSGKTTLLKMLSTLTVPTSGEIWFDDLNIIKCPEGARKKIGVFFEAERALYWRLTGYENLKRTAALKRIPGEQFEAQANNYLQKLGLYEHKDKMVSQYSRGMKVKLNIVNALLGNPEVLLFDEPLAGLDHISRLAVLEILDSLRCNDRIILICSNNLLEAQKTCDKVLLMKSGQVIANGSPARLLEELPGEGVVEIRTTEVECMRDWIEKNLHPISMINAEGKIVISVYDLVHAVGKFKHENVIPCVSVIYREKDLTDYFIMKNREENVHAG